MRQDMDMKALAPSNPAPEGYYTPRTESCSKSASGEIGEVDGDDAPRCGERLTGGDKVGWRKHNDDQPLD